MNRRIKILLSIVIVSLSALVVHLEVHSENIKTEPVAVQMAVRPQELMLKIFIEEQTATINFEIDKAIEGMNHKMAEIETTTDKKEWFIFYKDIIDEYSYVIDPPETIYDYFTEEELNLLFHVVQAEVGDEYSFESKVNVANVIFNRFYHERFPDTLSDILVRDQFSPIADGIYREVEVTEDTILACEYAFMTEDTTYGCLFFDSNNTLNYQFVFNDGAHNFYKYMEE